MLIFYGIGILWIVFLWNFQSQLNLTLKRKIETSVGVTTLSEIMRRVQFFVPYFVWNYFENNRLSVPFQFASRKERNLSFNSAFGHVKNNNPSHLNVCHRNGSVRINGSNKFKPGVSHCAITCVGIFRFFRWQQEYINYQTTAAAISPLSVTFPVDFNENSIQNAKLY